MSHGYPTRVMKLWDLISNGAQTPQSVNALAAISDLVAAWRNSAAIESLAGNKEAAAARAAALETGVPRSFSHGVGDGELRHTVTGQRWWVVLRPDRKLERYRTTRSAA